MLGGHGICPTFDSRALNLHGGAALPADKVMVVGAAALPIHRLAILTHDDIDLTGISHCAQRAVHRGEANAFAN